MICPSCSRESLGDEAYCRRCGAPLVQSFQSGKKKDAPSCRDPGYADGLESIRRGHPEEAFAEWTRFAEKADEDGARMLCEDARGAIVEYVLEEIGQDTDSLAGIAGLSAALEGKLGEEGRLSRDVCRSLSELDTWDPDVYGTVYDAAERICDDRASLIGSVSELMSHLRETIPVIEAFRARAELMPGFSSRPDRYLDLCRDLRDRPMGPENAERRSYAEVKGAWNAWRGALAGSEKRREAYSRAADGYLRGLRRERPHNYIRFGAINARGIR